MDIKVNNYTNRDLTRLIDMFFNFEEYAREKLGYDKSFTLNFISDKENGEKILGKTAYYVPSTMEITIFVDNRHEKDMLRSISHELVHHAQNCRGEFDHVRNTDLGYAQDDKHLRKMEGEAYKQGNGFLVRDFEDEYKKSVDMVNEHLEKMFENQYVGLLKENGGIKDHYISRNKNIGKKVFKKLLRR